MQTLPFSVTHTHARLLRSPRSMLASRARAMQVMFPPAERFQLLAVMLGLSACVTAFFLNRAPTLGVDLNRDAALMAPLHWSAM